MNATEKARVTAAFTEALRRVRASHPKVPLPAATVQHWAWKRWEKFCTALTPDKLADARFPDEGADVARFMLLDEVVMHEKVKRST